MIAARPGIRAYFKKSDDAPWVGRDVLGFDDEGRALVIDNGHLECADKLEGFQSIDVEEIVSGVVPGGGWIARYEGDEDEKGDESWETPVLAWLIAGDGTAKPLLCDTDGDVDVHDSLDEPSLKFSHPDHRGA